MFVKYCTNVADYAINEESTDRIVGKENQMKEKIKKVIDKCFMVIFLCILLGVVCIPNMTVSAAVMKTDVSKPSEGQAFIGISGSYLGGAKEALDRINEIRKEACREGVINPSTGKKLKSSDYVPIKWSSSLEYIARIRAAEASLTMAHVRTNGKSCFEISAPDGTQSWGEVLAWNWSKSMVYGVNQWYGEKDDWVKQNSNAVTGHYTSMINPQNTFVGLGAFYTKQASYPNTVAGEFSSDSGMEWQGISVSSISQKQAKSVKNCVQLLEIPLSSLEKLCVSGSVKVGKSTRIYAMYNNKKYPLYKGTWTSSDKSVLTVDQNGRIMPKKAGKAIIMVKYGDQKYKIKIKVNK